MIVYAIIPARSGSKSIVDKNIKSLYGKPLLAYSIDQAKKSKLINRVIVATDNTYYAELSQSFGAETPFLRPANISTDQSTDLELFEFSLKWFQNNEQEVPDIIVHLRPTHPIRNVEDIDKMVQMLIDNPTADSIRSVVLNNDYTPYKMWFKEDGMLQPVLTLTGVDEPYNSPRQALPKTYMQNASIDVVRSETIIEKKSMTGDAILAYTMDNFYDIDYLGDFDNVKEVIISNSDKLVNKTFCIDIDGVIAHLSPDNDYKKAKPIIGNIEKINKLAENNKIILNTARGFVTGIDWKEFTEKQLKEWGLVYHELFLNKPNADWYIDDKIVCIDKL